MRDTTESDGVSSRIDEDSASSSSEWERSMGSGMSSVVLQCDSAAVIGESCTQSKPMAIKPSATIRVTSNFSTQDKAGLSVSPAGQSAMSEYEEHIQGRIGQLERREG